ncbi:MAG: cell envelope integrity protein CreD [Myxococcota bacterium]
MGLLIVLVVGAWIVAAVAGAVMAMASPETKARLSQGWRTLTRSVLGRLSLVMLTGMVLLVPLEMVDELRRERGYRLAEVQSEIGEQWGRAQTVTGPVLWVPVMERWTERVQKTDDAGKTVVTESPREVRHIFAVLPEHLDLKTQIDPRSLSRGLYDVLVYDATVTLQTTFRRPEFPAPAGRTRHPQWDEAKLFIGLSDLSAVSGVDELVWNGEHLRPNSGSLAEQGEYFGISGRIEAFDEDEASATVRLKLRGMGSIYATALGETSNIEMAGAWPSPSFGGFTLPADRDVAEDRFVGQWSIPGVARPTPQVIELEGTALQPLRTHHVGVTLVEPASPYASAERAITYGMLVIGLCLLTFLVLERGMKLELHPVQWLVNGLALVVFYLILLAASEHSGFHLAYSGAAAVTVSLISGYTFVATRAIGASATVFGSLSLLYLALYAMLRSEDYSLLTGTMLVVGALIGIMWVTRRMATESESASEPEVA